MNPLRRYEIALVSLVLCACGSRVAPDGGEPDALVAVDAPIDDRPDSWIADVPDVVNPDVLESDADAASTADVLDGAVTPSCATPEPDGGVALPGTHRSCDPDGGAPAEHCREVWQCGGTVNIYEPPAAYFSEYSGQIRSLPDCGSPRNIAVHPGYVDAYKVSVARFRSWVRAGRPIAVGDRFFPGFTVDDENVSYVRRSPFDRRSGASSPEPELCTYRDTPGDNDNLPMNCVDRRVATAFCNWDGGHLLTDAAWVYIAGNSDLRTDFPFGNLSEGIDFCARGDVGRGTLCPGRTGLPDPIDAYPAGATLRPAGIFGLFGSLTEITSSSGVPADPTDMSRYACTDTYDELRPTHPNPTARGLAAYSRNSIRELLLRGKQYRTSMAGISSAVPYAGFRCSRWVPEPR